MLQDKDNKQNLLRSVIPVEAGATIQMDNKIYLVKNCRQLLEALGEPDGYCLELEEVLQ